MTSLSHKKALVVLSGGQDSVTCLGWALCMFDEVSAITFNYGQRHAIELKAARDVVDYYNDFYDNRVTHSVVDVRGLMLSTSPLVDPNAALQQYTDVESMEAEVGNRIEATFVPMRNTLFLTLAANRAIAMGAGILVTGVCQADGANYPDCTHQFIIDLQTAFNSSIGLGILDGLRIRTPLMNLGKKEIVDLAVNVPHAYMALQFSHTAYDGHYPPTGHDHASLLRAKGFEQAGMPDPLVMRAVKEGLMELPKTANYDIVGLASYRAVAGS